MKKTLSVLCSLALVPALFADENSVTTSNGIESETEVTNFIACMTISSSSVKTIVAVPWCKMSLEDNGAIEVSNVVKTANLTAGDTLHAWNGSSFDNWILTEGSNQVLYWASVSQAGNNANGENTLNTSGDSATTTISRGKAIILMRQNPTNELGQAKAFYLYGQVATNSATTVIERSSDAYVLNLVASPNSTDVDWQTVSITNVKDGDYVWMPETVGGPARKFTYSSTGSDNKHWYRYVLTGPSTKTAKYPTLTMPAGTGFTYGCTNGTDSATINWADDAHL